MSGHSKWATIKRAKESKDAKRGNIFTKHAKNIAIAARSGGDPEMNASLKSAIENAQKDNMPNSNIAKAIKKGTGELKDGAEIMELMYEGYGPSSIAVLVICHTDNKQRTVANVRHVFSKHGGSMGENGCVSYLFKKKGLIVFENVGNVESLEMAIIEADCEDFLEEKGIVEVTTEPSKLHDVVQKLEKAGFKPSSYELSFIPNTYLKITEKAQADKIIHFMHTMEEDDDVNKVISNFDIEESLLD